MAGGALSFREDPFRLTPDRRYIFETDGFRRAFAMLLAGVRARRGVLMLTGPSGTGKTTLLQGLLAKLQHDGCVAFWRFHPDIPGYDIIGSCLAELEVKDAPTEPAARARALAKALTSRSATQPAVLIVDEAGQFADGQLAELAALPAATGHTLQVVLAGLPAFADRLNGEALAELRKAVTMRAELGPLERAELGAYIAHRCRIAGQSGPLVFEPQAIARVFDHTGGTPRLVNRLCATSLFFAAPNSKQISASVVDEAARACNAESSVPPKEQPTPPAPSPTKEQPAVPPPSASSAAEEASDRPVLQEAPSEVHRTLAEAERAWIASTATAAASTPKAPAAPPPAPLAPIVAPTSATPAEPPAPTVPALVEPAPKAPWLKEKLAKRAAAMPAAIVSAQTEASPPAPPAAKRRSPALRIAASVVVVAGSAATLGAILWPEVIGREHLSESAAPATAVTQLLVNEDTAAKSTPAPAVPIVEAKAEPVATPVAPAPEPTARSLAMKPVEAATREPSTAVKAPEPPAVVVAPVREAAPVVVTRAPEPPIVVAAAPAREPAPPVVTPAPIPEPPAPVAEKVVEPAPASVAALSAIEPANGVQHTAEAAPAVPAFFAPAPLILVEPPPPAPKVAEPVAPPAPKAVEPVAPPAPKVAEPAPPPAPKAAEPPAVKLAESAAPPAPKAEPAAKVAEPVVAPAPPAAPVIVAAPEVPKEPAVVALAAPVREAPTVVAVAPPPKPAPVPPRTAQAALPAADAAELQQLMARGDDMLRLGDPASARLFYERAAARGLARAYTAVGRTYDPSVLQRLSIRGGGANGDQALTWYRRGTDAGDADATKAADDLNAWMRRR